MNSLILGDCLDIMPNIKDKSIDLIFTDLPYGITANSWDKRIDINALWEQFKRIISDTGAIALFAYQPFTSMLIMSNLSMYKCSWVWKKNIKNNFINAKYQPIRITEDIIVFSNAGMSPASKVKCTYNPQGIVPYGKITTRGKYQNNYQKIGTAYLQEFTNYPTNILEFPCDVPRIHPTQKPLALCEYLIKTYTNESQLVLDPCMGSGTIPLAAKNTNRVYIGIEKNEQYYKIAEERL